jgi:hypothetical protein
MNKLLSDSDLILFKNKKYSEMSIFSKKVNLNKIGDYIYYESDDNTEIYYLNMHYDQAKFFIDNEKKIIFHSNYYHDNSHHFELELKKMVFILKYIKQTELDNAVFIGNTTISCCKWFVTYGHFNDESFLLCDFFNLINMPSAKVLLDYHTDNNVVKNYPVYTNYQKIDKYLFDKDSANAYEFNRQILKTNKLLLIKNDYNDKTFHSFPIFSRDKILSKVSDKHKSSFKNVFVCRNKAMHANRNFENETEIYDYLIDNSYYAVNPENVSMEEFIAIINFADNIIISWGGILTNMCYFKKFANVIVLKSKSYENEKLFIFQKIIDTYNLNIKVIVHENNKINIPFL